MKLIQSFIVLEVFRVINDKVNPTTKCFERPAGRLNKSYRQTSEQRIYSENTYRKSAMRHSRQRI